METCTILTTNNVFDINSNFTISFKEIKGEPRLFQYVVNSIFQRSLVKEMEPNLVLTNHDDKNLFDKIRSTNNPLKEFAQTVCGLTPYRLGKGKPPQNALIVKERRFDADYKKSDTYRKYLMGRDFYRYSWQIEKERWISYGDWLAEPRYKAPFNDDKKIIVRQTSDRLIAHLDTNKYLALKNVHNIRIMNNNFTYEYLLGLLNSKLLGWWYQKLIPEKGRVFAEVKVVNLVRLPIKSIDFSNNKEKDHHDEIAELVDILLQLNEEKNGTKLQSKLEKIEAKIEYCENKINQIIYQLYDLTDEEIKIVEGK